jgi:naphtho-gamma-pyrone polyketide synthase
VLSPAGTARRPSKTAVQSAPKPLPVPHRASKLKSAPIRQAKAQTPKQSNLQAHALDIVAAEIGIDVSELSEDSAFADFGVDSLLSLTVLGRLREELDLDVPSSLFLDNPRVGDLNRFFGGNSSQVSGHTPEATPETSEPEDSEESTATSQTSLDEEYDGLADSKLNAMDEGEDSLMSVFSSTLADEIGVSVEEIRNCPDFGELGMDSLMSLTVLGLLRERLGIDLPSSFFLEHSTLKSAEASLGLKPKPKQPSAEASLGLKPKPKQPITRKDAPISTQRKTACKAVPPASSILLQGNSKTASKTLFLFPDGSGSSTSYATLPNVGPEIAIVGLNCPYMKTPEDMKCTLHELNTSYMAEIRRRQPNGPYHLGGWSAGGICAYDVARRLLQMGEGVESLILIDSPFPIGLTKLPPRLYHFFNSISLFGVGDKPPPDWLLPHFLAFVDALDSYQAKPFQPGTAPKTHLILARDGVYKSAGGARLEPQDDDTREMHWLLNDREDLGPNGWDTLVGGENLKVEVMEGANHFTMMEGERGRLLRDLIKRAIN